MKTRVLIQIGIALVLISACTADSSTTSTIEPTSENQVIPTAPTGQLTPGPDGFYFFKRSPGTPFTYSMAYAPAECLSNPQSCPNIEIVFGFPSEYSDLSGSILNWSPDGSQALFVSDVKLLLYTPPEKNFEILADDLLITSNEILWSPDQHWAALSIQGDLDYTSYILLFDPTSLEKRSLVPEYERLITVHPQDWLNNTELVVEVRDYGDPANREPKKDVQRQYLSVVNIDSNTWTEIEENAE